jgi:hypothetical protein
MATQTMISARHLRSMAETYPDPRAQARVKESASVIRKVSDDGAYAFATTPEHAGEDG